jgi:hypothetical protein
MMTREKEHLWRKMALQYLPTFPARIIKKMHSIGIWNYINIPLLMTTSKISHKM